MDRLELFRASAGPGYAALSISRISSSSLRSAISSVLRSKLACMFIQNSGVVRKYFARRSAVYVGIDVCSAAIRSMRR